MEKNSQFKNITLGVLLVAVVTLSIAYAALSRTLTINGQATVKAGSNWKVEFVKTATDADAAHMTCIPSGYAAVTTQPTIAATSFSGLAATFKAPGDKVTCEWDVENKGTINAYLKTFTKPTTYSYAGSGTNKTADENAVKGKINYTLKYKDNNTAPAANDALPKPTTSGYKRTLVLVIEYDSSATTLPTNDVAVTGFTTTFLYEQQ